MKIAASAVSATLALAIGFATGGAAQPVVVDLGTLGGTDSNAHAVNNAGQDSFSRGQERLASSKLP